MRFLESFVCCVCWTCKRSLFCVKDYKFLVSFLSSARLFILASCAYHYHFNNFWTIFWWNSRIPLIQRIDNVFVYKITEKVCMWARERGKNIRLFGISWTFFLISSLFSYCVNYNYNYNNNNTNIYKSHQ